MEANVQHELARRAVEEAIQELKVELIASGNCDVVDCVPSGLFTETQDFTSATFIAALADVYLHQCCVGISDSENLECNLLKFLMFRKAARLLKVHRDDWIAQNEQ